MLGQSSLIALLATTDSAGTPVFYEGIIGIRLLNEDDFAVV